MNFLAALALMLPVGVLAAWLYSRIAYDKRLNTLQASARDLARSHRCRR